MNAPLYETQDDRVREAEIAQKIEGSNPFKGCFLHKLPMNDYRIDYAIVRDGMVVGFAEVKRRGVEARAHTTTPLILSQWMHGVRMAHTLSVPFFVFVEFTDSLMYLKYSPKSPIKPKCYIGGRTAHPRDENEARGKTVVALPIERMRRIA